MRSLCVLILLLIGGCDYVHGVSRRATELDPVRYDCVAKEVDAIDGIELLSYRVEKGSYPLTLRGIQEADTVHRYWYSYREVEAGFYFLLDYKNSIQFGHSFIEVNSTPRQEDVDIIRPVMNRIEKTIEDNCEMHGFAEKISEVCMGVDCGE